MPSHPYLDHPGPIAFAHRGGATESPENSVEAFRAAHELGYRYLETDVHLTADGVLVAFHDPTLDRVTDAGGPISRREWAEIAELRVDGTGRIATMADLLTDFADTSFNIDTKSDASVEPLVRLIDELDVWDRVCIGSFRDHRLRRARELGGDRLCTSAGIRQVVRHMGRARGLPSTAPDAQAFQVPVRMVGVPVLTRRFVELAHDDGRHVHVWTVNDSDEMHRLLDLGVDGIMTDRPRVLREVMVDRGVWLEP